MLTWETFRTEREQRGVPFVVAHRGVPVTEPENTLASFSLALEQGADALETDLRFTGDDQIVLHHDETLDRTTDGQGAVRDHSLTELKRFRTKRPDGGLSDRQVPTLIELLTLTQGQTPLLLELKDPRFVEARYAKQLIDTLMVYGVLEQCAIISFNMELVHAVNAVNVEIPTGFITMWNPLPPGKIRLLGPLWPLLYLNPLYVTWAHAMDAVVAPLDPNPTPRLDYYLGLNVDALVADNPAEVLAALEQKTARR